MRFQSLAAACCAVALCALPAAAHAQSMSKNEPAKAMTQMQDSQHVAKSKKKMPAKKMKSDDKMMKSDDKMMKKSDNKMMMKDTTMPKAHMKSDSGMMMKKPA